ncbi:hypothetical protein AALP_AA5G198000 [Arabis alpina]|uniref:Uncharacterized protein n=1 Tax=Arabis alpina TaxID=50452 RepID=A0A087GY74_ARAAL|nr:hypothetical protein AALP_AA5G198000 [Arabis alpina]
MAGSINPKICPWVKFPTMKPSDQSGSYQRMNPKRSHDPETKANF